MPSLAGWLAGAQCLKVVEQEWDSQQTNRLLPPEGPACRWLLAMGFGDKWATGSAPLDMFSRKHSLLGQPLLPGNSLIFWVPGKGQEVSAGRQLRSPFFEPPRGIYQEQLLPGPRPPEYKAQTSALCAQNRAESAIMASTAAILTWALALLSALSATQARRGFWDYFSQSSRDKGREEQSQQQKLVREPASLKDSLEQDVSNMNTFLEKLGPQSVQAQEPPRLPRDPASIQQQLQEELEELKARLEPYMAEVHELVGSNLEGLRQQLKPYTQELMEQVALQAQELQEQLRKAGEDAKAQLLGGVDQALSLLQELQGRVRHHTSRVKELFHPYAERLLSGIGHHVQELHRSVAPHAAASPARLSRCMQALSHKLTLKAGALHARIQQNLDQLRDELSAFVGASTDGAGEGVGPDPQVLSEEVRQRLQAFRHDTFLQIADFTRAIDQETQEVQQQLAPPPPGHSAFAPEFGQMDNSKALSKLQARLDDLWEDITYSLHDQGHGHLGEP